MSIQTLKSGRLRVQVYDPSTRRNVSITRVLTRSELEALGAVGGTFGPNERKKAKRAREKARDKLGTQRSAVTVGEFYERWTTDQVFARPKESTDKHNHQQVRAFVRAHEDLPVDEIDDDHAALWLAGGRRNSHIAALRLFFYDAMKVEAGRLTTVNPFARLGIAKTKGNKHKQPPTEQQMWALIGKARELTPPSFANYLELACFTGMRPGELDALRWDRIRWADGEIDVKIQWSARVQKFTDPKYGPYVTSLVEPARRVLLRVQAQRDSDSSFVFTTLRGTHYTPSSRTHHWNRVRAAVGLGNRSFYLCTKHYFGWYAVNVLGLDPAIVAEQFGHRDGGTQVEQLYGHPDKRLRRAKIREAFEEASKVQPLRVIEGGESA